MHAYERAKEAGVKIRYNCFIKRKGSFIMAVNENCINYLLTIAQHTVFQYFSCELEQYGLTPAQYGVLSCLWDREASTPKQLAEELYLEMSTISGVLDRMQKKGLIERAANEADRRGVIITATEKGMVLKEPVIETIAMLNKRVMSVFNDEAADTFRKNLKRVAEEKF